METLHPGGISEACDTQKENKLLVAGKADTCKILKEPSLLLEAADNCWRKRVMGGAAERLSSTELLENHVKPSRTVVLMNDQPSRGRHSEVAVAFDALKLL